MPLHHVVLALLAERPSHGYELRGAFEEAVGPQWGQLNIGHLYQLLDRLAADGLTVTRREPQPVKPERTVHELTDEGYAELDRWLASGTRRSRGFRDEFFLKVIAAHRRGDQEVLDRVLHSQREQLLGELRGLSDMAGEQTENPVVSLLIANARLHVEADLRLVDEAETALPAVAQQGRQATRDTQPRESAAGQASQATA